MKIEVQFVGSSIDVDTYEGECVTWLSHEGQVHIYAGKSEGDSPKVASYSEGRVVRVKVIEA